MKMKKTEDIPKINSALCNDIDSHILMYRNLYGVSLIVTDLI